MSQFVPAPEANRPNPGLLTTILTPLASLRLTVVLFAMAILIVLAGTLAQVNADVWDVVDEYFRVHPGQFAESGLGWLKALFVWIPGQIFFPKAFFPNMGALPEGLGFWYPKGWLIGGVMLLNLLSAHLIRFKLQARGPRLIAGLWMLVLGVGVTWAVIASGTNHEGFQTESLISYRRLWDAMMVTQIGVGLGCLWLGTTLGRDRRAERALSFGCGAALLGLAAWLILDKVTLWQSNESMRILYQLVKGTIAGLVLLGACQLLFKKRAGIVLLHGGVALLMFSEVLVGLKAVETKMMLGEGETSNYVIDTRNPEIAVIDASDPERDTVTVVPMRLLTQEKQVVKNDLLPFDIESVQYLKNAVVPPALPPEKDNKATRGIGLDRQPREVPAATGVSNASTVDTPALYIKLTDKKTGADLGTWMTYVFTPAQAVEVDGKTYLVELRFGRTYLPYSMRLIDVRKDDYLGTKTTRNYSSQIQLIDPEKQTNQEVNIWMNNPLRYRGQTFYQSGYQQDEQSGAEYTTLQVVSNTGWMIPYVSCMIVGVGMTYQFLLTLLRFLNRSYRDRQERAGTPLTVESKQTALAPAQKSKANWLLPLVVCLLAAGYVGSKTRMPKYPTSEMDLTGFARLPVAYEGRVKPIDTVARNALLIISGKQEYKDKDGKKQPAVRWLLNVIAGREEAQTDKVFRITNLEVLKLLKLEPVDGFVYNLKDIIPQLDTLLKAVQQISDKPAESLTVYERSLKDLYRNLDIFQTMKIAFDPPQFRLPPDELKTSDPQAYRAQFMQSLQDVMARTGEIEKAKIPLAIPVPEDEAKPETKTTGSWQPYSASWIRAFLFAQISRDAPEPAKPILLYEKMLNSYHEGKVGDFNTAVHEYGKWLKEHDSKLEQVSLKKVQFEQFFNHFAPFYWCMVLCLFVFLLSAMGWLGFTEPLRRSAFWLMALTFAIHTFALISRIYISGRPPVTNLYTTGIFIGWAVVLLGLVCERIYKIGVGNAVASNAGFLTLGISHFLAGEGDTFTVLEAVLDTQFWLATHVVTINLGYAALAASGFFGVYSILYRLTPSAQADVVKSLTRMIYGSMCFAVLFSFIGTVLGGLWADDSWGRFWGWDPKENGALIIVLWSCLVLHARWAGMVRESGLAVLATLGIIAVTWSWFGTNQLGAGLHAYGFTDAARTGLFATWSITLIIAGLGILPQVRKLSKT